MKPYPFSSLNHLTVPFWRSEGAAASILMVVCGLFWWVEVFLVRKWLLMSRVLVEGTEELNLAWPAFLCCAVAG